jgi:hypothetical protein
MLNIDFDFLYFRAYLNIFVLPTSVLTPSLALQNLKNTKKGFITTIEITQSMAVLSNMFVTNWKMEHPLQLLGQFLEQ